MNFQCLCFVKLYLVLSFCGCLQSSNPVLTLPLSQIGYKAIQVIKSVGAVISNDMFQENVIRSLGEISQNIGELKNLIKYESNYIIQKISAKIDMQTVKEFKRTVYKIDQRYEDEFMKYFLRYDNVTYHQRTIDDYITATISSQGFKQTLSLINEYTIPISYDTYPRLDTVFEILHNDLKTRVSNGEDCGMEQSGHQQIYALYNLALVAVTKGYIMIGYAYKYLQHKESNKDAYKAELQDAEERYKKSVFNISQAALYYLKYESRSIRQCEPSTYIEGLNYKQFKFLSSYLVPNRVFTIPKNRKCTGKIRGCKLNYNIDGACLASPETGRVYEYINEHGGDFDWRTYTKGRIRGKCSSEYSLFFLRDYLEWRICLCEEPYSVKRGAFLNMTAQITDIQKNRVITGVRFVSKWSITYIEIQSGQLINSTIDAATVEWHNDVTRVLEENERNNVAIPNDIYADPEIIDLKESSLSFNLDDVILPTGMVVAGVKFELKKQGTNSFITLMVAGWKVYNALGYPSSSQNIEWFSMEDLQRNSLNLKNRDLPTEGPRAGLKFSEPGKSYVQFEMTDWNRDASQTVIPFLDLQEVVTSPPVPLGGLGIFHKAPQGYGGFISLKLITTDYTYFMSDVCLNNTFWFGNNPLVYVLHNWLAPEKELPVCMLK